MAQLTRQRNTRTADRPPPLAALWTIAEEAVPRIQLAYGFGVGVRAVVLLTVLAMIRWDPGLELSLPALNELTVLTVAYLFISSAAGLAGLRGTRADLVWTSIDILLITWIVWLTGGLRSDYYLLYYLPILQAGLVLRLRDALSAAILATLCYFFIGVLQQFDLEVRMPGITRVIAFAASGVLVGFIIEVSARRLLQYRAITLELERSLVTLGAAYEVVKAGTPSGGIPFVQATLAEATAKLAAAERVFVLVEGDGGMSCAAAFPPGAGPDLLAPHAVAAAEAWQCALTAAELDVQAEPLEHRTAAHLFVSFPLVRHGRAFGVLQVACALAGLEERDLEAVIQLVEEVSIVWENVALREEVQRLATEDYLTGLWNRREIERLLAVELSRAARHELPLSVAMLDIDDFKRVNDTGGHLAGDQTLRDLGAFLKSSVRSSDQIGRYGGDEFLLVMPHTDPQEAVAVTSRLRKDWADSRTAAQVGEPAVTISGGIAGIRGAEMTRDGLVDSADTALYEAKAEGKDRVRLATGWPRRRNGPPAQRGAAVQKTVDERGRR